MSGAIAATLVGVAPVRFDGSFDKTAAAGTVTSDTRTAFVAVASAGEIDFVNFSMTGSVQPQYSLNGGSFTNFGEGDGVTIANGQTLAVQITLAAAGESLTFDVLDVKTNRVIEQVTLAAT